MLGRSTEPSATDPDRSGRDDSRFRKTAGQAVSPTARGLLGYWVFNLKMATPGTPQCYNLFAGTSGTLLVHPYLREVVQSTADRLGHPGLILPVAKAMPAMATTGD